MFVCIIKRPPLKGFNASVKINLQGSAGGNCCSAQAAAVQSIQADDVHGRECRGWCREWCTHTKMAPAVACEGVYSFQQNIFSVNNRPFFGGVLTHLTALCLRWANAPKRWRLPEAALLTTAEVRVLVSFVRQSAWSVCLCVHTTQAASLVGYYRRVCHCFSPWGERETGGVT